MNHRVIKSIMAAALSIFILTVGVVPLPSAARAQQKPRLTAHLYADRQKFSSNALNENTGDQPDRRSRKEGDSDADSRKKEPVADPGSRRDRLKPKPLTPFVPSEKIPADQAVDFPTDI